MQTRETVVPSSEALIMGLEKRTVKIIAIVVVVVLILAAVIGLTLGLLLNQRYVELGVWPRSDEYYSRWEEPLIKFRPSDPGSWHPWVRSINEFLSVYESSVPENPARAPCSTHPRQDQHMRSQLCDEAMRGWAPCTVDNFYGYADGMPCVFLRLDHIHYWVPEPYNVSVGLALPNDMPQTLKHIIHQRPAHQYGDYIWVSCEGQFPGDQENIGPVQYVPVGLPQGFPTGRLHTADRIPRAARSQPDRDPGPLVGVFFEKPRRGVLINVECRIWSRDIYYDRSSRVGRTRFELHIE